MKKVLKIAAVILIVLVCGFLGFGYWLVNGSDSLALKSTTESGHKFTFLFPKTSVPFKNKSSVASVSKNGALGLTVHAVNKITDKTCEERGGKTSFRVNSATSKNSPVCRINCDLSGEFNQCYTLDVKSSDSTNFEVVIYGKDISQRESLLSEIMNSVQVTKI